MTLYYITDDLAFFVNLIILDIFGLQEDGVYYKLHKLQKCASLEINNFSSPVTYNLHISRRDHPPLEY